MGSASWLESFCILGNEATEGPDGFPSGHSDLYQVVGTVLHKVIPGTHSDKEG